MQQKKTPSPKTGFSSPPAVQLSLMGLILFSMSLVATSGAVIWLLVRQPLAARSGPVTIASDSADAGSGDVLTAEQPWGELITENTYMESPMEYAAFELQRSPNTNWTFAGMATERVGKLMSECGMNPELIAYSLSPDRASRQGSNLVIRSDPKIVTSLTAEMRARLYGELARNPENQYMRTPFTFPLGGLESLLKGGGVDEAVVSLMTKLSYPCGGRTCFSDLPIVLGQIPAENARLNLIKTMSGVSTVLARLRIRPTTDIDKLVGYWCNPPGVRAKDVRPLLESVRRLENGGSLSLVYLLPPFARKRLFTFPSSVNSGEAEANCHWSTMNFFSEAPDDRFFRPSNVTSFVLTNYYVIAKPGRYGDLVFLLDKERGEVVHSAVYLADDIVFTKNGNGVGHPWQLMRLNEMISMYSYARRMQVIFYRNKAT